MWWTTLTDFDNREEQIDLQDGLNQDEAWKLQDIIENQDANKDVANILSNKDKITSLLNVLKTSRNELKDKTKADQDIFQELARTATSVWFKDAVAVVDKAPTTDATEQTGDTQEQKDRNQLTAEMTEALKTSENQHSEEVAQVYLETKNALSDLWKTVDWTGVESWETGQEKPVDSADKLTAETTALLEAWNYTALFETNSEAYKDMRDVFDAKSWASAEDKATLTGKILTWMNTKYWSELKAQDVDLTWATIVVWYDSKTNKQIFNFQDKEWEYITFEEKNEKWELKEWNLTLSYWEKADAQAEANNQKENNKNSAEKIKEEQIKDKEKSNNKEWSQKNLSWFDKILAQVEGLAGKAWELFSKLFWGKNVAFFLWLLWMSQATINKIANFWKADIPTIWFPSWVKMYNVSWDTYSIWEHTINTSTDNNPKTWVPIEWWRFTVSRKTVDGKVVFEAKNESVASATIESNDDWGTDDEQTAEVTSETAEQEVNGLPKLWAACDRKESGWHTFTFKWNDKDSSPQVMFDDGETTWIYIDNNLNSYVVEAKNAEWEENKWKKALSYKVDEDGKPVPWNPNPDILSKYFAKTEVSAGEWETVNISRSEKLAKLDPSVTTNSPAFFDFVYDTGFKETWEDAETNILKDEKLKKLFDDWITNYIKKEENFKDLIKDKDWNEIPAIKNILEGLKNSKNEKSDISDIVPWQTSVNWEEKSRSLAFIVPWWTITIAMKNTTDWRIQKIYVDSNPIKKEEVAEDPKKKADDKTDDKK